jgi:two-component system, chemotaxis family, chemotaxis protein CheY
MGYRILIVDDSATTRSMIKRIIGMTDISVDMLAEACDGKEALAALARHGADLVLADLNMPVMNGLEMIKAMQSDEKWKQVPVVIVSAEPNIDRLAQLHRDGAKGFVRKPFTPEAIRNCVTKVMGGVHV